MDAQQLTPRCISQKLAAQHKGGSKETSKQAMLSDSAEMIGSTCTDRTGGGRAISTLSGRPPCSI